MPVRSFRNDDGTAIHIHDVGGLTPVLDLTSRKWNLVDGQASVVEGCNVIDIGVFETEPGRKPVRTNHVADGGDLALTGAWGIDWISIAKHRINGIYYTDSLPFVTLGSSFGVRYTGAPLSSDEWGVYRANSADSLNFFSDSSVVGGRIIINAATRTGDEDDVKAKNYLNAKITAVKTYGGIANNMVVFKKPVLGSIDSGSHIEIVYDKLCDRRGIWATDGRYFWLFHAGAWVKYIDAAPFGATAGDTWDVVKISERLLMCVNPKMAPIVINITMDGASAINDSRIIAGCLEPQAPNDITRAGSPMATQTVDGSAPGWICYSSGSGDDGEIDRITSGSTNIGRHRIMVRAVNLEDDSYSKMAPVYTSSGSGAQSEGYQDYITVVTDNSVIYVVSFPGSVSTAGGEYLYKSSPFLKVCTLPPPHLRWTHLEIWRSDGFGANFYLERRIPVRSENDYRAKSLNEYFETGGGNGPACYVGARTPVAWMSDTDVLRLPQALSEDIVGGYPPPACSHVASLDGITVCAGAYDKTNYDEPTFNGVLFWVNNFRILTPGSSTIMMFDSGRSNQSYYAIRVGDKFVCTSSDEIVEGEYTITAVDLTSYTFTIDAASSGTEVDIQGYIYRTYTYEWPKIVSDDEGWYSRTDKYAPESFNPNRRFKIPSAGDKVQRMVRVGNYIAMIMKKGVYLLYRTADINNNIVLRPDTIAETGEGTPWPNSVIAMKSSVIWATKDGPKIMVVSNEPNSFGRRGNIEVLGGNAMRFWFKDAYDNGYSVDAGFDEANDCVRFRKKISSNSYKVLQFGVRTQRWTELDNDPGIRYANTVYADTAERDVSTMYTVTDKGDVFECNHTVVAHPFDSKALQGSISSGGTFTRTGTTQINGTAQFDVRMRGEIVRFRSTTTSVNGALRTILTATANAITFDSVTGLNTGDEFIIGRAKFRVRFAPFQGSSKESVKSIYGVQLRAMPGQRSTSDLGLWDNPPTGDITVRCYSDFQESVATDDNDQEIPIFDADDTSGLTSQRISTVQGEGHALELEIESLDARTDFSVEDLTVRVEEMADDDVEDVSSVT